MRPLLVGGLQDLRGQLRRRLAARHILHELDCAHGAEAAHVADAVEVGALCQFARSESRMISPMALARPQRSSSLMMSSTAWAAAQATGLPA